MKEIKDMKEEIHKIMVLVRIGQLNAFEGTDKVMALKSENTESVSASHEAKQQKANR